MSAESDAVGRAYDRLMADLAGVRRQARVGNIPAARLLVGDLMGDLDALQAARDHAERVAGRGAADGGDHDG